MMEKSSSPFIAHCTTEDCLFAKMYCCVILLAMMQGCHNIAKQASQTLVLVSPKAVRLE